jgi:hypothetical protein
MTYGQTHERTQEQAHKRTQADRREAGVGRRAVIAGAAVLARQDFVNGR